MESARQKVVVVGAGPVGALAALYAAQRGDDVEVYELRGDPRDASTIPLNWTKSINLALSERGINAIRGASDDLLDAVMSEALPMGGRMIHGRAPKTGQLFETAQAYDIHGRNINAIDRLQLNKTLLNRLDGKPNVKLFFKRKLTGVDYRTRCAWIEDHTNGKLKDTTGTKSRYPEVEITFDFLIGADGAHSAARYHLMKFARMSYEQTYIDTLWCEFNIAPLRVPPAENEEGAVSFALSPRHLHIWPGSTHMFIAIPSIDGSFTCTLFAPDATFAQLRSAPDLHAAITRYFRQHFPGVSPELIPEAELVRQFQENPAMPLISIKCSPYHFEDSGVILGDAAHAMVPFYGQGMNAGLEDVHVLFECLDRAGVYIDVNTKANSTANGSLNGTAHNNQALITAARRQARSRALARYTEQRAPDAAAINDLALGNYREMRAGVTNPLYKLRKRVEETICRHLPAAGFATQYARVSFTNQRYSDVRRDVARQATIEMVLAAVGVLVLAGAMVMGLGLK